MSFAGASSTHSRATLLLSSNPSSSSSLPANRSRVSNRFRAGLGGQGVRVVSAVAKGGTTVVLTLAGAIRATSAQHTPWRQAARQPHSLDRPWIRAKCRTRASMHHEVRQSVTCREAGSFTHGSGRSSPAPAQKAAGRHPSRPQRVPSPSPSSSGSQSVAQVKHRACKSLPCKPLTGDVSPACPILASCPLLASSPRCDF